MAQRKDISFNSYSIPGVGRIEIPACMEEQSGFYKKLNNIYERAVEQKTGIEIADDKVVFQQKGLNNMEKSAFSGYARVIVETEMGDNGAFNRLHARLYISPSEIVEIDKEIKNQILQLYQGTTMKLIEWYGVSFVDVNGMKAMKISYLRQLNNQPYVLVNSYRFQNYDRLHTLTMSYRKQDEKAWKPLYKKILFSFYLRPVF
jgi:hypothetical protein